MIIYIHSDDKTQRSVYSIHDSDHKNQERTGKISTWGILRAGHGSESEYYLFIIDCKLPPNIHIIIIILMGLMQRETASTNLLVFGESSAQHLVPGNRIL